MHWQNESYMLYLKLLLCWYGTWGKYFLLFEFWSIYAYIHNDGLSVTSVKDSEKTASKSE